MTGDIGIHIHKDPRYDEIKFASLEDSIEYAKSKYNISCCQIFTHNPSAYNKIILDEDIIFLKKTKVHVYVHAPYTIAGIWKDNKRSQKLLRSIDIIASEFNSRGIIIHIPKNEPKFIANILKKNKIQNKIILELSPFVNSYAQKNKLKELIDCLDKMNIYYGICIDTAHMWAAGLNIRRDNYFFDYVKGIKKNIALIHLNGTLSELFNSGRDVHIIPMAQEDCLWTKKRLKKLMEAIDKNTDIICEVNRGKVDDLNKLMSFLYKQKK